MHEGQQPILGWAKIYLASFCGSSDRGLSIDIGDDSKRASMKATEARVDIYTCDGRTHYIVLCFTVLNCLLFSRMSGPDIAGVL